MKNKLTFIDLFAGAGGLSLGFCEAGFIGRFAIEKNKDAFSTLKCNLIDNHYFNWPQWLPQTELDIVEVLEKYKEKLNTLSGKIDVVIGGPPCQGFSMAGRRDHGDFRNTMVTKYIEFVECVRPKYILLENVHGISVDFKLDDGEKIKYSDFVINGLKRLGYKINAKELILSEFGVPQKRKRFILIGSLKNNIGNFFDKLYNNKKTFLKSKKLKQTNNVYDAISDLLESNGTYKCPDCKQDFKSGKYGEKKSSYQKYMRRNILKHSNPDSHRFAKHNNEIKEMQQFMIDNLEHGRRYKPSDNLVPNLKRRGVVLLDPKTPSPTVTTHPDDFVHYSEPRILTVRELARLQSFPDWYQFKGKYTTGGELRKKDVPRFTQVGNAVPPLFAQQVAEIFKEYLNNE